MCDAGQVFGTRSEAPYLYMGADLEEERQYPNRLQSKRST